MGTGWPFPAPSSRLCWRIRRAAAQAAKDYVGPGALPKQTERLGEGTGPLKPFYGLSYAAKSDNARTFAHRREEFEPPNKRLLARIDVPYPRNKWFSKAGVRRPRPPVTLAQVIAELKLKGDRIADRTTARSTQRDLWAEIPVHRRSSWKSYTSSAAALLLRRAGA